MIKLWIKIKKIIEWGFGPAVKFFEKAWIDNSMQ